MTAENALRPQPDASPNTKALDSLCGVRRTGGKILAAAKRKEYPKPPMIRREGVLIHMNAAKRDLRQPKGKHPGRHGTEGSLPRQEAGFL